VTRDAHPDPKRRKSIYYSCDRKPSHDLLDFDLNAVSDFCAGNKDNKALYARHSVAFSGKILYGNIVGLAFGNWRIVCFFTKQFWFSFLVQTNQLKKANTELKHSNPISRIDKFIDLLPITFQLL